jgi:hypothetical protein
MTKLLLAVSTAVSMTFALSAAQAMPMPNDVTATSSAPIILTAGGCGPAFHRGPYGGCRPNAAWHGPYWRGPGWRFYNGCWRGPAGRVHCR